MLSIIGAYRFEHLSGLIENDQAQYDASECVLLKRGIQCDILEGSNAFQLSKDKYHLC